MSSERLKIPVPVVLASASPQRRELLQRVLADFEVCSPLLDEASFSAAPAEELALELAQAKARDVGQHRPEALVIAADTVVECRGEIIGKPADRADAVRILTKLSSLPHRVVTGLSVIAPDGRRRSVVSVAEVRMRKLPLAEIEAYLDREDALGRAGAYGLEELDPNVESLKGSPTAVMGLPLEDLRSILTSLYPQQQD